MEVDPEHRLWYTFGDGQRKQCVSHSTFHVQAGGRSGKCQINALEDAKGVPILLAVNTLRSLGAVIDFETCTGCLKKIDANRMIKLDEDKGGHLYLSLVKDLLSQEAEPESVLPLVPYAKTILEMAERASKKARTAE